MQGNKTKPKLVEICPSCGRKTVVSEVKCPDCGIVIRGEFELPVVGGLTKEDEDFIRIFLKNAGNLKEVQGELGLSYPTVRKMLDRVVKAYGGKDPQTKGEKENEVISKLKSGEINVEEALAALKG